MNVPGVSTRKIIALTVALLMFSLAQPGVSLAAPASTSGDALKSALIKTAPITVYRMDMDMIAKGALVNGLGGTSAGSSQEESILTLSAAVNGKDAQFTMKGVLSSFMGADPSKGVEFITVAGKSYVHGPLPMIGAKENKRYVATDAQGLGSMAQSQDLGALAQADMSAFKLTGSESLDNRRCEIYGSNDKLSIAKAFQSFGTGTFAGAGDMQGMDWAELKFWVCDDGYFHKLYLSFEGAEKANPANKGGMTMSFHIYDFNAAITITPPAGAVPLEQSAPVFQTIPSSTSSSSAALSAKVVNGGNIRQSPGMQSAVLGQLHAGELVTLVQKTTNGQWYYVNAPEATGWVHASLLRVTPEIANRVFVNGEAMVAISTGEQFSATVINGGNRRAAPNVKGEVLGQVHAGDTIQLLAKTKNGTWYYVRCRCGALGWVHASLLKVDPKVARKVPVG
jgi:SH3-like domain-containing protein